MRQPTPADRYRSPASIPTIRGSLATMLAIVAVVLALSYPVAMAGLAILAIGVAAIATTLGRKRRLTIAIPGTRRQVHICSPRTEDGVLPRTARFAIVQQ